MIMSALCVYTCISICVGFSRYRWHFNSRARGLSACKWWPNSTCYSTQHIVLLLRENKNECRLVEDDSNMWKENIITVFNSLFCNCDAIIYVALLQFRELFVPPPPSPAACLPPLSVWSRVSLCHLGKSLSKASELMSFLLSTFEKVFFSPHLLWFEEDS